MKFSSLFRQPLFWLGALGLLVLAILAFWHVQHPADASGNSLILSSQKAKAIERALRRQAVLQQQDSLRAMRADTAAAALYRQGQQDQDMAQRLHQREQLVPTTGDTSAGRLQQELSNY